MSCIFCRIISKEIPSQPVIETPDLIVIKDIQPKAPIHYLIMPKKHVTDVQSLSDGDSALAGKLFLAARDLAATLSDCSGFKLVVNSGKSAGQSVFHLHLHFLAGKQFGEL